MSPDPPPRRRPWSKSSTCGNVPNKKSICTIVARTLPSAPSRAMSLAVRVCLTVQKNEHDVVVQDVKECLEDTWDDPHGPQLHPEGVLHCELLRESCGNSPPALKNRLKPWYGTPAMRLSCAIALLCRGPLVQLRLPISASAALNSSCS